MKNYLLIFTFFLAFTGKSFSQLTDDQIVYELFENSYKFWQQLRHDNGIYKDGFKFNSSTTRGSIANAGMGLVSLCIGHEMGWEPNAESKALKTLKTLSGETPGFTPAINAKGCYIHFFDINSGDKKGDNWSPIDTDIMLSGALFVKRYFHENAEIARYVDNLFNSVDQSAFIGDVNKGQIALGMKADGTQNGNYTIPFNEYMIVAWLAKNQSTDSNSPANKLWNKHYETTANIKKALYGDDKTPVLSPSYSRYTSMFAFLFNYYLIHHFSNSQEFVEAMSNAAKADSAWWADQQIPGWQTYEWGTGAGAAVEGGYRADRIFNEGSNDQNPERIVSPHILAGFSPVHPNSKQDLVAMYKDPRGVAKYELLPGDTVLWRYGYTNPEWRAVAIQGVDYSCMLFGLAALPEFLSPDFFNVYNDFFNPEPPVYHHTTSQKDERINQSENLKIYPNPAIEKTINIECADQDIVRLNIYNTLGSLKLTEPIVSPMESCIVLNVSELSKGIYTVQLIGRDNKFLTTKLLVN